MNKKLFLILGVFTGLLFLIMVIVMFWAFWMSNNTSIEISTEPLGAAVLVDNEKEFISPAKIKLSAGEHELRIQKDGYGNLNTSFTIKGGEKLKKNFKLISVEEEFFITKLPYENMNFKVEYTNAETGEYTITLYPIINGRADDAVSYPLQLKRLKELALAWVKQNGLDPTVMNIKWIPEQ